MRERNYVPTITDRIAESYLDMRQQGVPSDEAAKWARLIGQNLQRAQDEENTVAAFVDELDRLPTGRDPHAAR